MLKLLFGGYDLDKFVYRFKFQKLTTLHQLMLNVFFLNRLGQETTYVTLYPSAALKSNNTPFKGRDTKSEDKQL